MIPSKKQLISGRCDNLPRALSRHRHTRWFRFSSAPFDEILHTPATVFTYCDLPSFAGYGGNVSSAPKMASELLKIFGNAALMHSGIVKKFAFEEFKQKYNEIVKNDAEQPKPLEILMQALMTKLDACGTVILHTFAFKHALNVWRTWQGAAYRIQIQD